MITERAMLAAVHISIWTAIKHDRKISRDVADQHGAHQGAGRYNKQLLRGADKLDELRTLAGQVRQHDVGGAAAARLVRERNEGRGILRLVQLQHR